MNFCFEELPSDSHKNNCVQKLSSVHGRHRSLLLYFMLMVQGNWTLLILTTSHKIDVKCPLIDWLIECFEVLWLKSNLSFCLNNSLGNWALFIFTTWHKINLKCPFTLHEIFFIYGYFSTKKCQISQLKFFGKTQNYPFVFSYVLKQELGRLNLLTRVCELGLKREVRCAVVLFFVCLCGRFQATDSDFLKAIFFFHFY